MREGGGGIRERRLRGYLGCVPVAVIVVPAAVAVAVLVHLVAGLPVPPLLEGFELVIVGLSVLLELAGFVLRDNARSDQGNDTSTGARMRRGREVRA